MKNRNIFILITALCLTAFILSACGYLDGSEQGSININFDNSGARYAVDKTDLIYTITLTSPGKDTITKTTKEGDTSISIPVSEGAWKIDVQAEGSRVRGVGDANVAVTAGKPAPANIKMKVTGTRVYNWDELKKDFNGVNDGSMNYLDNIEIKRNLEASETVYANSISLNAENTITLWSENNVSITRKGTAVAVNATVFTIYKGTLILDGTKGGEIKIDGNKNKINTCNRALINVDGGTLIMRDGVTLTNNSTGNGGGVWVSGSNSYFYMDGGVISGNDASDKGGGVCILDHGRFEKTIKGIIYGSGQYDYSNNCNDGATVNDKGTTYGRTLNIGDTWPLKP